MQDQQTDQRDHALVQKSFEYLRVTRDIRWVIIAAVLISFHFLPGQEITNVSLLLLAAAAALYNSTMYIPGIRKQVWLTGRPSIILMDSAFILALVSLSAGKLDSPYTVLFVLTIISSAFWYGGRMVLAIGTAQVIVTSLLLLPQMSSELWKTSVRGFALQTVVFVAVGLYVALLTRSERKVRLDFAQKDYQVNKERQQLLALINNIADAVMVVDESGKIGLFNDATAKLVGSQYALVGKPLSEVFKLLDENDQEINLSSIRTTTPIRRRDLKVHLQDSSTIKVEADISPYIVNQQHSGFIIIMRDITKERTVEQQQSEFISVASHELRTPLAIAEANISTSLASPNAPTDLNIRNMLTQAHNNIVFLSNIINDLTTLSKAERDELKVDPDLLDPADLLSEIQRDFLEKTREKGLELKIEVGKNVHTLSTSRYRVKQIVQNFLTNAIKYSRQGTIVVAVHNAPNKDAVVFSVKDTGLGISVSDQEKLFTKFFRSEDYQTRQSGGSGLGLYISATLAKRLGGRVWCESKLKEGSTFFLEIPPYQKRAGEK